MPTLWLTVRNYKMLMIQKKKKTDVNEIVLIFTLFNYESRCLHLFSPVFTFRSLRS